MRLEASLQVRQEMRMKLAPQIIQSIEILQLPLLELRKRLDQELMENPMLERDAAEEGSEQTGEQEPDAELEEQPAAEVEPEPASPDEDFETVEEFDDYCYEYVGDRRPSTHSAGEEDPKLAALENSPAPDISLREHLIGQLAYLDIDDLRRTLCENIIANLDDRGYLVHPLEDIAASMEFEPTLEESEDALKVVQGLEPPGVAARSLEECLLLQLDERDEDHDFLRDLILNHFKDLLENKYPKVAKEMNCSIERLTVAAEKIGQLNPIPGSLFGESTVPHIIPDLRVENVDGEYKIVLEESSLPSVHVSNYYVRKLRQPNLDEKSKEYLKGKLQSARWIIEAIEQRRSTVYNVASEIVKVQKEFLDRGEAHLKPLKMQDIADRVGVHVSTVSRAIADKYMQIPRGIYSLKYFFTGGVQKDDGEMASWEAVRKKLQDIVDHEDKSKPLSDEEIARKLQAAGIDIARRTVSKYRKNLAIPSSARRKHY